MHTSDIRELDRIAVLASVELLAGIGPADLIRPTPCTDWNLGQLLAHMTAQHHGFAAAAAGNGDDLSNWVVPAADEHIIAAYAPAAHAVIEAFAAADLDARFELAELGRSVRGRTAIGFHFLDYVVHSWDVARSLDRRLPLTHETVAAALPIARAVPDGPQRRVPGASFAPARPMTASQDQPLDELLTLLGRSPDWPR